MAQEVKRLLRGNYFDQAYFLYLYAMELNYAFLIRLQDILKGKYLKLSGGMNRNMVKIAQKIKNT